MYIKMIIAEDCIMILMIGKILEYFKKRPGLAVLMLILSIITIVNIKPDFYLLGWDNYSSFFNLESNIFRTFFATWREYRGLGVASDAEVTDVFRQIFYWITSFIFPEKLLDQVYYLTALWLGILSIYGLAKKIFKDMPLSEDFHKGKYLEFFATVSAFFYLFNLNTLSIFYSPIIPFTNRFYSLPLTLYFFYKFIDSKKRAKDFLILALVVIFTSGSYVTPTVFVTTFAALGLLFLFKVGFKKTIIYSSVFLLLNAFWLFPFINYTVKKSPIIPLARTFIEINESTLNQPKSNFDLAKQSMLYPSFFDIKFPSLKGNDQFIHPQLDEYRKPLNQKIFLLFPILYVLGGLVILRSWKKHKKILWLPFWVMFFLFLSTKQYGPLGILYDFLDKNIPYFGIIFRIGDTKFHAYVSVAGSLMAAYFLMFLLKLILTKKIYRVIVPVLVIFFLYYTYLFRGYFTGNLINFILYVKIPAAYYEIADKINRDPEKSRVLHLPFDSWHHYWRSFSWGYLGSSFYNYFLDKPYVDKTFEPGSMENAYLHGKINTLLTEFYRVSNDEDRERLASRFLNLLSETGIKYVLLDSSISSTVFPKNINYTAKQSFISAESMLDYLYQKGSILKENYEIKYENLYEDYKNIFPIKEVGMIEGAPVSVTLSLFELPFVRPQVSFSEKISSIDGRLGNLLETDLDEMVTGDTIQTEKNGGVILPFIQQNHRADLNNKTVKIAYNNVFNVEDSNYVIRSEFSQNGSYMVDVYGNIENGAVKLDIYHRYLPDINGKRYQNFLESLVIDLPEKITDVGNLRISVGGVFSNFPTDLNAEMKYINSFMVHGSDIKVELYSSRHKLVINPYSFENKTSLSNCKLGKKNNTFFIDACAEPMFVDASVALPERETDRQYYVENSLSLKAQVDGEKSDEHGIKLAHGYICIDQGGNGNCINLHRNVLLRDGETQTVSEGIVVSNQLPILVQVGSIPFSDFKQSLAIEKYEMELFESISEGSITISQQPMESISADLNPYLEISFPQALSNNSFYFDREKDLYDKTIAPCGNRSSQRINRMVEGVLINKMEGCLSAFAQTFDYSYRSPYLMIYDYWVGSGQQPLISLKKKSDTYFIERASLNQGYPNIEGMKSDEIRMVTASKFIEPRYYSDSEFSRLEVNFFQDTINQGFLALGGLNLVELPTDWYSLRLDPENGSMISYKNPEIPYSVRSILPSLWTVKFDEDVAETGVAQGSLLYFNEGYDQDWGLYNSAFSLITGRKIAESKRCNGYANCFEIDGSETSREYFIFYWPEKLYLFGWFLTILTIILSLKALKRDPLNTE